jgi:RNA polymerase sigma-70 factor, ECF subfamily
MYMGTVATKPAKLPSAAMPSQIRPDFSALTDEDLVRYSSQHNMEAFEQLYIRHHRTIFCLCLRMLKNHSEAEDLTQDIFLRLFDTLSTFRGEAKFTTWLYRLSFNEVLMHWRKQRNKDNQLRIIYVDSVDLPETPVIGTTDPRRQQTEQHLELKRAISSLASGYKDVFILYEVLGFDHRSVGNILGVTEGTTKSQLYKAKRKLREFLNKRANPVLQHR